MRALRELTPFANLPAEHRRSYPQVFSNRIVEIKRAFRTYLEIFNGLWAPQEGIEEALDDLEASVREAYEPLFVSDDSDTGDMDTSSAQNASAATRQMSSSTAELTSTPDSSRGFAIPDSLPPISTFGKPTPITRPSSQNELRSNTSQLSAKFGEAERLSKSNSSTASLGAGKGRNPFGQTDPIDSTKSPKIKNPFSAPPGKWQFPKDIIENHATKLASPAHSTTKISEASSVNTTTQPVPFAAEGFSTKPLLNPFSQALSGNTIAQSSPFSNSNPFQTASRNPFSQVPPKDSNAQSTSPAPFDSSKSVSPNPFPQLPWTSVNGQSAAVAPLDSSNSLSPNPFSQVSWPSANAQAASPATPDFLKSASPNPFSQFAQTNANAQSTSPPPLDLSKPDLPNPFFQVARTNANAQSASAAPSDLSKPIFNPFSQAAWTNTNAQSASPAPLDLSKSVSPNPFPQVSFEKFKAPESAPPQPLPLSNLFPPSSGPTFTVSTGNPSAWPEVSPFYGSFGNMTFNNPVGMASLPTLEELFSYQQSVFQAKPQNSFFIPTSQPDQSTPQLDRPTLQPSQSLFQLDQSKFQPFPTTFQPDASTFQSDVSTSQPIPSSSQPTTSASQFSTSASQPITSTFQLNISAPPDASAPQLDKSIPQPDKSAFQFLKASSQLDKSTPQPGQSTLPPGQPTTELDIPAFQHVKASSQSNEPTPQPDLSISRPDKSTFEPVISTSEPVISTSQPDKATSQPDKPISVIQNATWTSSKFEETPYTLIRRVRKNYEQARTKRAQKKADEHRVMVVSKKYIKKWRQIAWKKGLMRRAPERRRKFAESLQQMARDAARHQENLVTSLLPRKSGKRRQQAESEVSTDSILTHSRSSKKRKSSDDEDDSTPDRMSRRKRSRLDQIQTEHVRPSQSINSGHKRSRTEENPKLSEREELINTLIATRDDYSYLANGSESSYKITQKIRTLLPPVKVDDTRSSYFLLKSLGIDPDTPVVPRTSRKRHSSDDIVGTPFKRLKESPQTKSASAMAPPSERPRSRSPSPLEKSSHQDGERSETAQSKGIDKAENKLLLGQLETNNKTADVVKMYKEHRAKWGSRRISYPGITPSRNIEYYKEQRAKWGSPTPNGVMKFRQSTTSKIGETLRAAPMRHAAETMISKEDTKSAIRAEIEQRQRDWYATMQPAAVSKGELPQLPRHTAAAVGAAAGSSAEAAIEL